MSANVTNGPETIGSWEGSQMHNVHSVQECTLYADLF